MSQRFEDNLIKAITTSDVQLLKSTLESSEKIIAWNQTIDGLSVLALSVKFFNQEVFDTLYPPLNRRLPLPPDIFTYIIEHAPKILVDTFASNIIETINYRLNLNDILDDDSDAEQILKTLRKSTQYISAVINHPSCNLVEDLFNSKTGASYLSLLLIKSIEWDNPKLLNHAIEQIEKKDHLNWCDLSYKDWNTDHIQQVFRVYSTQSYPLLNRFLNKISENTWHSLQKAQNKVMLYSTNALKELLNDISADGTKSFIQNAPQYALQRLSDEDVLKILTSQELANLYNCGAGCTIEKYDFLSSTPIRFEIPIILEQHRRIYLNKTHTHQSQTEDKERQNFQALSKPLLSSAPYAFQEKRMDLELYYKSIHGISPNQSVSVLECLQAEDRSWAEKCLLHEQINDSGSKVIKKSKI